MCMERHLSLHFTFLKLGFVSVSTYLYVPDSLVIHERSLNFETLLHIKLNNAKVYTKPAFTCLLINRMV